MRLTLLLFPILLFSFANCEDLHNDNWSHKLDIDAGNGRFIKLNWRNYEEHGDKWLEMLANFPTTGYVGLGFSPHGGMDGADILIGWIDEEGPHIMDTHGVGNAPIEDIKQDFKVIAGENVDGRSILKFKRKWDTGDEKNDRKITEDTLRLIWAFGEREELNFEYHGPMSRGVQSIFIETTPNTEPFPDEGENFEEVKWVDIMMNNTKIEPVHTTYLCNIVKVPHFEKKHHFIGFKPLVQPENRRNLHHFCVFECIVPVGNASDIFDKHVGKQEICYTPIMPGAWTKYCNTVLFCWIIGSGGEMFPKYLGTPFMGDSENTAKFLMTEVHYNNPEEREFVDSSGVRLFFTDKLRKYDSGLLYLGHRISPFHLLPPKQDRFISSGICSDECTREGFPPEGVKVVSVLLHAHLKGRKVRLRHFRNGKELPVLAEDNHFDFNYQQSRFLKNEVRLLPGDELLTQCEYNTKNANRSTPGGFEATQEMCLAFVFVYPRTNMAGCGSQPEFHTFLNSFGVNNVSGPVLNTLRMPYEPSNLPPEEVDFEPLQDAIELEKMGLKEGLTVFDLMNITQPESISDKTLGNYIENTLDWNDKALGERAQDTLLNGEQYVFCTTYGRRKLKIKNHKVYLPISRMARSVKSNTGNSNKSSAIFSLIILGIIYRFLN